jgi:hypothetical protein
MLSICNATESGVLKVGRFMSVQLSTLRLGPA